MGWASRPAGWPRPRRRAGWARPSRSKGGCGAGAGGPACDRRPGRDPRWNSVCPDVEPRILVVDDHPIWRHSVAAGLEEAGCAVAGTAGDGAQALRVAAATRPGVVLLDLNLPDMSGAEVTRRLLAADPAVRVLILSASGERQDVLDAMTAGATGYLVKSAQFSEMLEAVRAAAAGKAVFTPGLAGLVL